MQTTRKAERNGSPPPGAAEPPPPITAEAIDREARRTERDQRRGAPEQRSGVMIPRREKRLPFEAPVMRVIATAGIVAISVVVAAIMASQDVQGWLIGLVVSLVSLVLAAVLWSSRRL